MARDKGKRGERAVIDWLQPIVDEVYTSCGLKPVLLQRNTIQSDRGGSDLVGLPWLSAEVKNVENDSPGLLAEWWNQTEAQARQWAQPGKRLMPVLFYMRNRRPIRVRMRGILFDSESEGEAREAWANALVDVSAEDFENYFRQRLKHELQRQYGKDPAYARWLQEGNSPCG